MYFLLFFLFLDFVGVCGGGRYIRSWKVETGALTWEINIHHIAKPGYVKILMESFTTLSTIIFYQRNKRKF